MAGERCSEAFWDEVTNPSVEEGVVCRSGGKQRATRHLGGSEQMDVNRDRTVVYEDDDVKRFVWNCAIAHYDDDDGEITYKDCGWKTKLTKDRLNQVLPSDKRIQQKEGKWYLDSEDWDGRETFDIEEIVAEIL